MYTVTLMMGTNYVSRGESRKVMRLHDKMSSILEELQIQMDPAICTTPYNKKADQHAMEMNEKVRMLSEIIRQIHQRSVLPVRLLDLADQVERSFPENSSSDGISFDSPRNVEWLNNVFQRQTCLRRPNSHSVHPQIPRSLPQDPCPVAWERESTQETALEASGLDYWVPRQWKSRNQSHR